MSPKPSMEMVSRMVSGGPRIGVLLLFAATPPAIAYSPAAILPRPKTAAAAGHAILHASDMPPCGMRAGALRSQAFPSPLAKHITPLSRLGSSGQHVRGLRMTASMAPPASVQDEPPVQLPLKVISQRGRLLTAQLELDMQGTWLLQGRRVDLDEGKGSGIVLWQRIPLIFILRDDEAPDTVSYFTAVIQPSNVTLSITDSVLGKVLDAFGRPIDSTATSRSTTTAEANAQERSLFGSATQLAEMATISRPLHTGITAVDALTPIGKGQNMLIVGSEALGRRKLALDTAITQSKQGTVVVYVDTSGNKDDVPAYLKDANPQLSNVVVVRATISASNSGGKSTEDAALGVAAAATGCTVAEYFRAKGRDTLVVIDDLDVHKKFWDLSERDIVALYGADFDSPGHLSAANSEQRAFFSTLFQRVGYLNLKAGGGSLTMLLLVDRPSLLGSGAQTAYALDDFKEEVYGGKVRQRIEVMLARGIAVTDEVCVKLSIPPPGRDASDVKWKLRHIDELISLSDGQVILSDKLAAQGLCPALDSTCSLTRIGIGADNFATSTSPAMRSVAARLRMDLAQASDIPPGDMSPQGVKQRARAKAWEAALQQPWGAPRRFAHTILALLAASTGKLDKYFMKNESLQDSIPCIQELFVKTLEACPAQASAVEETLELKPDDKKALLAALDSRVN